MTTPGSRTALVLLGLLVALAPSPLEAQVGLSSAVELALRNSPKIKIAEADVAKAHASVSEAKHAYVPIISAGGGYGRSTGVPLGLPTVFEISAQSLAFNFSQVDNVRAAESAELASLLSLHDAGEQLREDVATTYLNLDNAQQRLNILQQESQSAKRLQTILQERLAAGFETQIDLLKAQRVVAQVRLANLNVDQEATDLARHLATLIGTPGTPLTTRPDSIPPLPSIVSLDDASKTSPGVEAAFRIAESKDKLAVSARHKVYSPQVFFSANYTRIDTSPVESNFLDYYPDFKDKEHQAASIAVQVQLPLFNLGEHDRARQAAADAARARWEAESERQQFFEGRAKVRHSLLLMEARSELARLDRDIAHAELEAIQTQLSAGNGSSDQPQLTPKDEQNARIGELQRQLDMLDAQSQLQQSELILMRQTGHLDDWLKDAARR